MKTNVFWRMGPLILLMGCNQQDTDGLARVGKKILVQASNVSGPFRDKFDSGVRGLAGVRERVQARLQWDKQLAGSTIEVHVAEKTIELKGAVQTEAQRQRAVQLAESTQGVDLVSDQLRVTP